MSEQKFGVDIQGSQFGVMSPDEIRRYSVVEVTEPQQFENGRPVANGPFDLRMGSITRQLNCATCHQNKEDCPGHFGHIELEVPVYHPFFIEQVKQILNCVCHRCSELLLVKDEAFLKAIRSKTNPKARSSFIYDQISKKHVRVCGYCNYNSKKKTNNVELQETVAVVESKQTKKQKKKTFSFTIGRGTQRLLKEKEKTVQEPIVQGSSDIFSNVITQFVLTPQEMPTLETLKDCMEKKKANLPVEIPENSTINSSCFSIQPKVVRENTNLYTVWPENDQLFSFLQHGTVAEEEPVEEEEHAEETSEDGTAQTKKRKKKTDDENQPDKKKRKKIKDATFQDVTKLLKSSPFSLTLPPNAGPGTRELLDAKQAHDILCRISPENCYLLGYDPLYAHPSWFILTCLLVIPPCARKLVDTRVSGSHIPLDDISFKLVQLVKKNNDLKKQKTFRDANFANYQMLVTFHVMTLINNKLRGQTVARRTPKSAPLESLSSGIKGKGGRVRGTLLGKRSDFTSRAVVGPGDGLRSDELAIPLKVAQVQTVPETVNRFNIERLQEAVNRGPKAYRGGANYVTTPDGIRYNLAVRKNIALRVGYSVDRHIIDGDVVVFNRQPSLHRMSMMGHYAVIHDGDNFQINLAATTPYNADFDGDEMNCHVPQSIAARVEISNLMMLPTQYISPQKNSPIMGLIQDLILAARLMTRRNMFFDRGEVFHFVMLFQHARDCDETKAMFARKMPQNKLPVPAILRPKALWTGKQILSMLLPEDLNYERRSQAFDSMKERLGSFIKEKKQDAIYFDPSDTMTIVRNGELLCGLLDKKSLGASGGSFVHIVFNDHGGERCRDMNDAIGRVLTSWIRQVGFSVGIDDMVMGGDTDKKVAEIKQTALQKVQELTEKLALRQIEEIPGKTMDETYEILVTKTLKDCRDDIGNLVQSSSQLDNRLKFMETAGSKGNLTNLAAICGGFGQGMVAGKRIDNVYYGRTTPHALQSDKGDVEGKGFIASSYLSGLKPREFFNHNMSGREGLTNTAVKTSETGYIQRKLINNMADATVSYINGSVRSSTGEITQFIYGEDAMDGIHLERQPFLLLTYDDQDMMKHFYVGEPLRPETLMAQIFPQKSLEGCLALLEACNLLATNQESDSEEQQEALTELRFLVDSRNYLRDFVFRGESEVRTHLVLPKNLKRLVEKYKGKGKMIGKNDSKAVRDMLACLLNKMMDSKNGYLNSAPAVGSLFDRYRVDSQGVEMDENTAAKHVQGVPHSELLAAIFVHYVLSPKRLIGKLSLEALQQVCDTYAKDYFHSRIHPGEAAGTIAAQSLGEPQTQLALDSFHNTGHEEVQLTTGLPRFKELSSAAKQIQTPAMSVYLRPEWRGAVGESNIAKKLATSTPEVLLETFLLHSDPPIFESEQLPATSIERDQRFLKTAFESNESLSHVTFSPWSVRFILNRESLTQHQITLTMIAATLRRHVQDWASVFSSDDNDCNVADNVGGIIRLCLHAAPLERDLDWQKPNKDTLLDPSALENVTDEEWKFACCEQYAQQALMHCLTVKVAGTSGVSGAVPCKVKSIRYCNETGAVLEGQNEWMIKTQGTNLREILTVEGVDWTRTISNHAIEVQKVLGIEAARAVLLDEIKKVFSCSDAYVDYRYISLLVDKMTADGQVTPVSRHAFRKMLNGPYTRAAFEQQTDVLCDAAMNAEYEDGNDMRAAIMMGKRIPQGTGTMFDTICSLDALTTQESKTMQTIYQERNASFLKNPFGFTGVRENVAQKQEPQKQPQEQVLPSNPFLRSQPLVSHVIERKNPVAAPRQLGKRYRMHSPTAFLE